VALVLAALLAGCDGSGQRGSAFVSLSVDGFSVGGQAVAVVAASQNQNSTTSACVTLRNNLKNPTVTAPTALDNVVIQSYTVTVRALDGRILVGPFTIGAAVLVPAGTATQGTVTGNTATFGVVLLPAVGKPTGVTRIVVTAEVVFRGRDGRGSSVETQGSVAIEILPEATDSTCGATAGGGGGTTGTTTGTTGTTTGTTTGGTTGGTTSTGS
jgi:hypothetical protein